MENYGLCIKMLVKAVEKFDGRLAVRKSGKEVEDDAGLGVRFMRLRVYDWVRNAVEGFNERDREIYVTPFGSFKWKT